MTSLQTEGSIFLHWVGPAWTNVTWMWGILRMRHPWFSISWWNVYVPGDLGLRSVVFALVVLVDGDTDIFRGSGFWHWFGWLGVFPQLSLSSSCPRHGRQYLFPVIERDCSHKNLKTHAGPLEGTKWQIKMSSEFKVSSHPRETVYKKELSSPPTPSAHIFLSNVSGMPAWAEAGHRETSEDWSGSEGLALGPHHHPLAGRLNRVGSQVNLAPTLNWQLWLSWKHSYLVKLAVSSALFKALLVIETWAKPQVVSR